MSRHAIRSAHQAAPPSVARVLDVGRGLAIVLVIYGHALSPWVMNTHGWFIEPAFLQWKLGASFLMPFFFVLSGMSWREEKTIKAALREALTLILTALLASVVIDVVRLALTYGGGSALFMQPTVSPLELVKHVARMALYGDFYSLTALWFLSALGLTRLLAAIATRFNWIATIVLAIALIAGGLAAQMMSVRNFHQIYLLGGAFSFFMLGHATRALFERATRSAWIGLAMTAIAGVATFATFDLNQGCTFDMNAQCGIPTLNDRFGVAMIYGAYGNLALFAVTAIAGVVFGLGVTALAARFGGPIAMRLNTLGRATLNLLIINALVLEFINPQVERVIAPQAASGALWFFAAIFVLALAVTLTLAAVLRKPLRMLRTGARNLAHLAVDLAWRAPAGWRRRRLDVSAAHEP